MKQINLTVNYNNEFVEIDVDGKRKVTIKVMENPTRYFIKYAFDNPNPLPWKPLKDVDWFMWGEYIRDRR